MTRAATIRPEDVVVGLLAYVSRHQKRRFEADPVSLHPRFFEWREKEEYARLFGEFVFDTRDYFPFSETLDSVLDGLQFAGYLERTNPSGTWYQIRPSVEKLFDTDISSRFDSDQLRALEALAGEFVGSIQTDPRA
jgi:hypothetical protein